MNPEPVKDEAIAPPKSPCSMRLDRVQSILETDPALKDRIGPKDQEFTKRSGEKVKYSRGVVAVAKHLQEHGFDPHNAPRPVVLNSGSEVLRLFKTPSVKKKTAPEPPKPVAAVEVKRQLKVEPVEVKVEPKVEPKIEPKIEPVAEVKPAPAKPAEEPKPRTRRAKPSPPQDQPVASATPPTPAPPITAQVQSTPSSFVPACLVPDASTEVMPTISPFVSVLSLFLGAYNLLKTFDREPGAEKRIERLNEQIDEMNKLRDVMVPIPINTLPSCLTNGQNSIKSKS